MPEVIPVKALAVILFSKLIKVIDNHEESFITENGINIIHTSAEIINHNPAAHKFSLIHVKSRSKNINVNKSVNIGPKQKNLISARGMGLYAIMIILLGHEGKKRRNSLDVSNNIMSACGGRGISNNIGKIRLISGEQFLHRKKLVKVCSGIKTFNNASNKRTHAIFAGKSKSQIIVLNSSLINELTIQLVINSRYIGNFTLIDLTRSNLRVILASVCDINENFLDGITITLGALLKRSQRIFIQTRVYNNSGNTINKNVQKLISHLLAGHNKISDLADISGSSFGDSTTKHYHFRSNSIYNLSVRSVKSNSHSLFLQSLGCFEKGRNCGSAFCLLRASFGALHKTFTICLSRIFKISLSGR